MKHYHNCYECYEHFECHMDCTLEYDLCDDDRLFGYHCKCFECEPLEGYNSIGMRTDTQSFDWFATYNGLSNNKPKYTFSFDRYNGIIK